ncbi:MAG: hypothetical protein AUK33_01620 [Flavobacteriaceae bacterium CG2_30_34_30]|nr:VWA domain-containing protein [Flavobacteriia bacterium]OIP52339.1 MAG: hypothetical protein AUK33_01620 [Flavobacteriaceae bacterium CG2_30_34_30]PIQ17793.1 MAG: hypothetical protein COW66_10195 [Flavobacteriaceae bacterium CG18_big_fil_WC_8_21_14_2_50_34_36]PIV50147.1 MAG: hypothetical protein COS19_04865 [Flavobacteriaceae bacterium CG02_land_8_20_14_3_00_34_13]PIZ08825.1 MAG: hypothetical protein COY56_01785 [Flavobacteriaceae bacterium CG_4_10_14_0_8_um_filter_34_31]PJC06413.1 MAG: hyp
MFENPLLFIILIAVIAVVVAFYMYGYKTRYNPKLRWTFGILRFLSIFLLLLLFINPTFTNTSYKISKPTLAIVVDNTQSINYLNKNKEVIEIVELLKNNSDINSRFDVQFYTFGDALNRLDSLTFSEKQTNISKVLVSLNEIHKNEVAPTLLITDGNQTVGSDYEFTANMYKQPIFTLVVGDTIRYSDLRISQLNVNRYAYLKNEFPIEIFIDYTGNATGTTTFILQEGNTIVHQQPVSFSPENNAILLNVTLPANQVGVRKYTAEIKPIETEKNKENNKKQFAVEVIDQATNVLIVSDIVHPDIGGLVKSISSNEQRKVIVKKPTEAITILDDFQLIILYQPNANFKLVMDKIAALKLNTWIITGVHTNWNFLNSYQKSFVKKSFQQEDVQGVLNSNYGAFASEDIGFSNFPPLKSFLGDLQITVSHEVLLQQRIMGLTTENPLLATYEEGTIRSAILDGEGIWKWRASTYLKESSFQSFDNFMGSLMQYLASKKRKNRLEVHSESFYYQSANVAIKAQFFDKNYIFDDRAALNIQIKNTTTEIKKTLPLLLKNNYYEVNLNNLDAGNYSYTISVEGEAISASGSFSIIDFNVENQFINADVAKLERVSAASEGDRFYLNNVNNLISNLTKDSRFASLQKSEQKIVPLLEWKFILFLLIALLAIEWFIRKYNGLI